VPFALRNHPEVREVDIPAINAKLRVRIKKAIETRLAAAPHQYGEPLKKTLKGYGKLRVGDCRWFTRSLETKYGSLESWTEKKSMKE
jgi:mRNA interferase RelE/StbE